MRTIIFRFQTSSSNGKSRGVAHGLAHISAYQPFQPPFPIEHDLTEFYFGSSKELLFIYIVVWILAALRSIICFYITGNLHWGD